MRSILFLLMSFLFLHSNAVDPKLMQAFQKSVQYEDKKDYDNAIEVLKPYASATSYEVNVRMGWLYYSNQKYTESVMYYNKAKALKPNATEPLWGITYPLAELKKWADLQAIYQKILMLDPKNTVATYRLGLGAYYDKKYMVAKKYFDSVLSLYPLDSSSLLMSAWSSYFLGDKAAAKSLFDMVLMLDPENKSATEGLALVK